MTLLLTIAVKAIPLRDELSPFQFCDETIWLNEVSRMIESGSLVPQEFRSGSISILPVFLVAKFYSAIFRHNLTTNELTLLARFLLIIGGAAIAFLLFGRILQKLHIKSWLIAPACVILLLNPAQLAFGRYWYPDHFIILPSTIFLLACINIVCSKNTSPRDFVYVGLAFALIISTKYTAVSAYICILPLVTVGLNITPKSSQLGIAIKRLLIITGTAVASFAVINYGIFFHFAKFLSDFKFNLQNYSQLQGGLRPFLFYAWMLIVAPFGLLGLPWVALGVRSLWKNSSVLLLAFVPWLVILLIGLARSGLTPSRNIAIGLPFITLIFIVGVDQWASGETNLQQRSVVTRLVLLFLLLLPVAVESLTAIRTDLHSDSRDQAVIWVKSNIPKDVSIGSNEFCSGLSPGDVSGYKTTIDPTFGLQLDYYLLNSYWDSPLSPYYQSISNQRFFHFYRIKNSAVPSKFPSLEKAEYVPEGYKIVKAISGDGPEIVILKKDN